jgi:F5/8 type C domain/Beta xylosidase C-terminal Concanavalin A-like domain
MYRKAALRTQVATAAAFAVVLVGGATTAVPAAAAADAEPQRWVVAHGSDVVEQTAADDLAEALGEQFGEPATAIAVDPPATDFPTWVGALTGDAADPDGVVVLGTAETNPLVAAAAPFDLAGDSPERFALRGGADAGTTVVYAVGATPRGAQFGAVELKQRLGEDLATLAASGAPAFRNRVGGHVQTQGPAPGWTVEDQAQYYVDHHINVVWGEKYGPPLPADVLERYGLGLALEVTLPPVPATWWDDPANASAAYYRDTWSGQRRVVNPFDPVGRQTYYDAFRAALDANPSTAILYTLFGDYSFSTDDSSTRISDGQPCGCTAESSALEVMKIMKQAVDDAGVDVTPSAWLWHLGSEISYDSFMRQLKDLGIGAIYNEAGDSDDWVTKRTNFDATALAQEAGATAYGPDYAVLVSAGGSCESIDPVIGIPTPHAAASKLAALADAGVQNFFLWWGSGEGWSYSANMSVVREMVVDPGAFDADDPTPFDPASPEPLLARVAEQDFGALAPDVLRFWGAMDDALVSPAPDGSPGGLAVHSWYQRIGVYTLPTVFGGGWDVPLTPAGLANRSRFSIYENWSAPDRVVTDFQAVVAGLRAALELGRGISASGDAGVALEQMLDQSELYTHLFASQTHLLQALDVAKRYWVGGVLPDLESPALRAELEPIARAEADEMRALADLFATFPANASLTGSSRTAFENKGDRDKDLRAVEGKIVSTQLWLDELVNVAVGRPVTASPGWQPNRQPENAVDGNLGTLWHSAVADGQWIAVDLGAVVDIPAVVVRWNGNAPARSYRIEVADDAGGPWRTVADVATSSGGTDAFALTDVAGRYVRVLGLTRASVYGFAINELEVYGPEGSLPDPDPDPEPDPVSDGPYLECRGAGSDDFEGDALDTARWGDSVRLDGATYELADGALRLPTVNAGFDAAPFVLQSLPQGQWEVTTALELEPTANYHQTGLILWASATRYVKLDLFSSGGVFLEVTGRGFPGATSTQVPAGTAGTARVVWLRLTSDGETVTASRSADEGESFQPLGSPIPLAAVAASSIGVFALQGATGATPTTAAFHWVTFRPTAADLEACRAADPITLTAATSAEAPESGWFTTPPTVAWTLDGFESDRAAVELRVDGGEWAPYTDAVAMPGDGEHVVDGRAVLDGSVVTQQTLTVRVDGTAPTTTLSTAYAMGPRLRPQTVVTLTSADEASGVGRTEVSLDGGATWNAYTAPLSVSPYTTHTMQFRSVDVAGNAEAAVDAVVRPDLPALLAWLVRWILEHL